VFKTQDDSCDIGRFQVAMHHNCRSYDYYSIIYKVLT